MPTPASSSPSHSPSPAPAARRTRAPAAPVSYSTLLRAGPPAMRLKRTAPISAPINAPGSLSGGQPLSPAVRGTLEQSLQADLGAVRVHSDVRAQSVAHSLSARAFAYGNHIFLGRGEQATDLGLMAHETAHVLQQGNAPTVQRWASGQSDRYEHEAHQASAAVLQGESFAVREQTGSARVQRLGLSDILDGLAELAANVPGFTLLTVIIGRNPINLRTVERNFTNLLRGFMGLIPGGEILFQVLNRYGVVERIGSWVNAQVRDLGLSYEYLRGRFTAFTDSLSWRDIFSPGDVWRRAQDIFTEPITRIRSFISRLVSQAVTWLKETFMQPLSNFCREIPGYGLVSVLLGRDPFTNAPVPPTALNVVRAFAEFIPGGTEKVDQLVQSGALQRAYAWYTQETQTRNLTWARVTGTFTQAWDSLRLEDILSPIETLRRIVNMFRPLLGDLVGFARDALMKLLEFIFEAAMGAGGARILALLKRGRDTFQTIIRNPVGFLRNLVGAAGQGVRQFRTNILRHLREGVIAWLVGPVARAGIQMPERWDLRGIIGFVLQILGLTWDRVRQKLVNLMGERVVAGLEAGFQLIQDIRRLGLVGALRERVTEFFGQLREAALGSIRTFIQERLVMAGITQLLSLLNPVGAIIQAIIKTYTTIQFFIQRINQILDFVESIINSIAAIASGAIGQAANFVESTMARTIPLILDFLARFIGLGDVGGHVQRVIQGLQARVDQMLDRAVAWIRTQASRLASRALGGDPNAPSTERVANGLREAVPVVNRYAGRPVGIIVLRPLLMPIKLRHRLSRLDVVPQGNLWAVEAAASPAITQLTTAQVPGTGIAGMTSRINYTSGMLAGNVVGQEMVADPLGPDHPMGQEPAGANVWSSLLVTDPAQPNDRKYIRGHLLNHHIGGTGAGQNLFPITALANDRHESQIESRIKQWVNIERKWVYYRVQVTNVNSAVTPAGPIANNKIDAHFVCTASVIDTALPITPANRHNTINATIVSQYLPPAGAAVVLNQSESAQQRAITARPQDLAATIAVPTGEEYKLDQTLYQDLRTIIVSKGLGTRHIDIAIQNVTGLGPAITSTLFRAFNLSLSNNRGDIGSNLNSSEKSNLSRLNNMSSNIHTALRLWL